MQTEKISLLAQSIKSRIGPLSHPISYNGRHVSDRIVIAELENLIRICNATFPERSNYFSSITETIRSDGSLPLSRVIEILDVILELTFRTGVASIANVDI
ncbi:MAG: hypothetical protein OK439_00565 [Thaumarchaeota archaeon]|nr:hypothetical protein [Nitrososphaerota archaeon]